MKRAFSGFATAAFAVGCLAVSVEAGRGPFRPRDVDGSWRPAQETGVPIAEDLSFMPQLGFHGRLAEAEAPVPTAAPRFPGRAVGGAVKRHATDNTCAYVSGIKSYSLYCDDTEECVANSEISVAGCCPDTSTACPLQTTCYASSEESLYTTSNGFTLWCGNITFPECVTHLYVGSLFSGYTLLGCGRTKSIDTVYFEPTTTSTTSKSSTRSTATPTPMPPVETTTPAEPTKVPKKKKKTNVGAIVGGVVGGVAALALVSLGTFLLRRRNNNNNKNNNTGPPADAVGGAPLPMAQQFQQPYYSGGGPGGDAAAAAAGGFAAAGIAGAVASQQQQQQQQQQGYYPPGQYPQQYQQDGKAYDPYNPQGQQYDPQRDSVFTAVPSGTGPGGSPPSAQSPGLGAPQYGSSDGSHAAATAGQFSPQDAVSPFTAPTSTPAPGMGFHSGPVPATLDVAELPSEREARELA